MILIDDKNSVLDNFCLSKLLYFSADFQVSQADIVSLKINENLLKTKIEQNTLF